MLAVIYNIPNTFRLRPERGSEGSGAAIVFEFINGLHESKYVFCNHILQKQRLRFSPCSQQAYWYGLRHNPQTEIMILLPSHSPSVKSVASNGGNSTSVCGECWSDRYIRLVGIMTLWLKAVWDIPYWWGFALPTAGGAWQIRQIIESLLKVQSMRRGFVFGFLFSNERTIPLRILEFLICNYNHKMSIWGGI